MYDSETGPSGFLQSAAAAHSEETRAGGKVWCGTTQGTAGSAEAARNRGFFLEEHLSQVETAGFVFPTWEKLTESSYAAPHYLYMAEVYGDEKRGLAHERPPRARAAITIEEYGAESVWTWDQAERGQYHQDADGNLCEHFTSGNANAELENSSSSSFCESCNSFVDSLASLDSSSSDETDRDNNGPQMPRLQERDHFVGDDTLEDLMIYDDRVFFLPDTALGYSELERRGLIPNGNGTFSADTASTLSIIPLSVVRGSRVESDLGVHDSVDENPQSECSSDKPLSMDLFADDESVHDASDSRGQALSAVYHDKDGDVCVC